MTKDEIIKQLEGGKTVRHRFFEPGEYVYLQDSKIHFEDGNSIDPAIFWHDRQGDHFEKDWEILPEDVIQIEIQERRKALEIHSRNAGKSYLVEEIELGEGPHKKAMKYEEGILLKGSQHKARVIATGKVRIIL